VIDSYDEIPYDSTPIYETHPANLAVPARLFGLSSASPEACRYLEFGCASGGNLIPLAFHLPNSEFVGIERSAEQVRVGRELIEAVGLSNVRIEQADVLAIEPDAFGTFDYMVAHGFFSWVPVPVQQRMFEIVAASLAPHGIAYVSYNTFPGWRLRGMLRDVLRFHVRSLASPRDRLAAASSALNEYQRALDGQDDPVSRQMRDDIARLRTRHPSYVYHEFLVDDNRPMLFGEFIEQAASHGLQYLCESELHTMFGDYFSPAAQAWIDSREGTLAQEQAMDFLRNRAFRQTLLCHNRLDVRREIDLEDFERLSYHGLLVPDGTLSLEPGNPQPFRDVDGGVVHVHNPMAAAAVMELASRYPASIGFGELAVCARQRLSAENRSDATDHDLLMELVRLYLYQHIGASLTPEQKWGGLPGNRPRASRLARAQVAANLGHIATFRHKPMGVDSFVAGLIDRLDGKNDTGNLVNSLVRDIQAGTLVVDGVDAGARNLSVEIAANVHRMITMLGQHGILDT